MRVRPVHRHPVVLRALKLLEGTIVTIPVVRRPQRERKPGWSRPPTVIPCPQCKNRAYSYAPQGFPWRKCDGPNGCDYIWNPEEVAGT